MNERIRLLVIGAEQDMSCYTIPGDVAITYSSGVVKEEEIEKAQIILLTRKIQEKELESLLKKASAYHISAIKHCLISDAEEAGLNHAIVPDNSAEYLLCQQKCMEILEPEQINEWLQLLSSRYWSGSGGARIGIEWIHISPFLRGSVHYNGHEGLVIEENYGREPVPILSWRMNNIISKDKHSEEIYLVCRREDSVRCELRITEIQSGSPDGFVESRTVPLPMEKPYEYERERSVYLAIEMWAEGSGKIEVGPMHFRESRNGAGALIPGGVRHADVRGEEFFSYFDPMDCKPPLCVYFAGYHSAQNFEGYHMMRKLGAPFLLLTDPRLEGGSFYLGSEEYETKVEQTIRDALEKLGFTNEQLIMSGLSMGTYGAIYYGTRLQPHAIVIGKPLMNAGDIAAAERTVRPGDFDTSLDVLLSLEGRTDDSAVQALNERMWNRFDRADFSKTKFAVAYMRQDDYDPKAYGDILEHQISDESNVYGKGMEGRHNDNSSGINQWFRMQYDRILKEDYGR